MKNKMTLADAKLFYFLDNPQKPGLPSIVAVFNESEAALLVWYFKEKNFSYVCKNASSVNVKQIKATSLNPGPLFDAALEASSKKIRKINSRIGTLRKHYDIHATCRKLLKPQHKLHAGDVGREMARKGL